MTRTVLTRLLALCGAAAMIAGCSADSSTGATISTPVDLPTVLGQMSITPYVGAAASAAGVSLPIASANPAFSTCAYASASQSFVCPTLVTSGLTINESYALLDASGNAQTTFSPTTTAAVRTNTAATGTQTTTNSSLTLSLSQVMTVSGLLTGTHTLDGTTNEVVTGTVTPSGSAAVPISTTLTETTAAVVLPNTTGGFPQSGSITMDGTTTSGSALSVTIHAQITFNGTNKVPMTVVVAGFTEHCILDLTGAVAPACG